MVRIRDVGLHLKNRPMKNARIIRFGYSTLKILNRIRNAPMPSLKPKNDFTITEIKSFDERIDVFWDKIKDGYNFILEKNRSYLNWRYCGPRAGNNVVMQAEKDGEILGFIALELVRDGEYKEGFVTDLLALPGRLDVVDSLLRDACKYFDGLGINTVYLMTVKKHPYQGLSNRNGFIDSRKMPTIGCKITDKEVFEVLRDSSPTYIYLSYGDTL
jgi:hypothetical protein